MGIMRRCGFVFLLALCGLALSGFMGCGGAGPSVSPGGDAVHTVELPALAPGDTVVWEDERFRIVISDVVSTEDGMRNALHVHHKVEGGENFTVLGSVISFEAVVGGSVVVSEGTGNVRELRLYDARTGDAQLSIEYQMAALPLEVEDATRFAYYWYDDGGAFLQWDDSQKVWVEHGALGLAMRNASLAEAKARVSEYLFAGLTLRPYERVRVNVATLQVELLGEYVWGYAE